MPTNQQYQYTPREVLGDLSFAAPRKPQSQPAPVQTEQDESDFNPFAPPPMAAPPPPPPSDSDTDSVQTSDSPSRIAPLHRPFPASYQRYGLSPMHQFYGSTDATSNKTREQPNQQSQFIYDNYLPFQGYEADPRDQYNPRNPFNDSYASGMIRGGGDATIRPNTGETNDDFGGIGSLSEVKQRLRWLCIGSCVTAVMWEGFALPSRLLVNTWVVPAVVVLGAYLAFFCLLLLGAELNAPLRDVMGFLYHPIGRGAFLFLMSSMCFGILASWWEVILGLLFLVASGGYLYTYWKYPEYRREMNYDERDWKNAVSTASRGIAWANPYNHDPAALTRLPATLSEEHTSLLTRF